HDRYFLDRVATRIVELKNATTVTHHGNYSSFLSQRQIREAFLQSEKRRLDNKLREEAELARNLRASAHIRQAQSREKGIERLRGERRALADAQREGHLGKVDAVALKLSGDGHISAEVAIAEGVTKKFGDRALFENASFLIRGGEHVAFVGPNGCGKTTLIHMLLGEDADFQGVCRIGGWVRTGLLDQNAVFPDESLTMLEEAMARREQTEAQALRGLAKVGFYGDETRKAIAVLSGGERVRLKLALLLQQNPQCLVLDEPTNHLDLPAREAVERAIAGFEGTVIAVSHDRYFLNRCATRIIAFEDGALRSYDGNWDAYQRARAGAGLAAAAGQRRPEPAPPAAPAAPPANRPDRSEAARLEQEIEELERRMAQAVGAMGPDADPALYRDYGELQTRAAALMARWERLLDAQDA
ncbi:MAG: ABC-F family ATP-binding cassette domain-containing protein, partial [Clostridiales bacterium]|nr:ABC-F family ATP-binding cassette domain-containing protein [Clostridiales bacterium]